MNATNVIQKLKKDYPGKTIIENKNEKGVTTEIICEIEPTQEHPEYSLAIAIIDSSTLHYHRRITEIYKVIKGNLTVFKKNKEFTLKNGEDLNIKPGEIHSTKGNETWIECYSEPGWMIEDYINIEPIMKKYLPRK